MEALLVLVVVIVMVFFVLEKMTIEQPLRNIIYIILGVVFIVILLGYIGYGPGIHWR